MLEMPVSAGNGRCVKKLFIAKTVEYDEVLQARILIDLPDCPEIGKSEPLLDNPGLQNNASCQKRGDTFRWNFPGIQLFGYIPGNDLPEFYATVTQTGGTPENGR